MAPISTLDFTVNTKNLGETQLIEKTIDTDLAQNEVMLEIDHFSFTANNITYGVVGDRMNYWKFFPAAEGQGIIPVWGYANVVASNHPDIEVGSRYYGYYPMSTHLLVKAGKASAHGFMDLSDHRQGLPGIYNYYTHAATDPSYSVETEAITCLYRPLFVTSFLIDDFLASQGFYGATQVLVTSASSKTAQALAYLLAQRKAHANLDLEVIGLTSKTNTSFVSSLGWYDEEISYVKLDSLNADQKSVIVDFSGSYQTQYELQDLLKSKLKYNCRVGLADWTNLRGEKPLPDKGELFFAPSHAEKRQKDWGVAGFQEKVGMAWKGFTEAVQPAISIQESKGPDQVKALYLETLKGKIDPSVGNMGSLTRR